MTNSDHADETRRLERAFEALPKSRHWITRAHGHLGQRGLTTAIIVATLQSPTDVRSQAIRGNKSRAVFYKYYARGSVEIANADFAEGGAWFRVVLDTDGSLYTAFRDNYTELNGGRPTWSTPMTESNF